MVFHPSAPQLSEAVAEVLKEDPTNTDPKAVSEILMEAHPNWTLPTRRVAKFIKRHSSSHANPEGADDDNTVSTDATWTKRNKGIYRIFSPIKRLSPKKSKKTSPVPEKISQPVFEEPVVDEPVTDVYADDNVDSAKEDCECTACTIM